MGICQRPIPANRTSCLCLLFIFTFWLENLDPPWTLAGVSITFHSSCKADDPYVTKDNEMRGKTQENAERWKKFQMAMEKRPSTPKKFDEISYEPVTGMEFVWVPKGCFKMGSPSGEQGRMCNEGPVHEVCVDGFWMGKYEVTNAQYRKYKSSHNSTHYKGESLNDDNQPVVCVSWEDAKAFAKWLSRQNGSQYEFRLPTEAEWEYACRSGSSTARYWGDDPDEACEYANVYDNIANRISKCDGPLHDCDDGYAVAAPVGSFKPNAFGLYDMLGNVWEWCEDIYAKDAYSKHKRNNPTYTDGTYSGSTRVIRGGSWYFCFSPMYVRCTYRFSFLPGVRDCCVGFRLLRMPQRGNGSPLRLPCIN